MALMNPELVGDFIEATMEVDSLRVLRQMMAERLAMLQAKQPHHIRPMIQSNEAPGSTPTAGPGFARRQEAVTAAKAAETKTPNKRAKMK